VPYHSNRARVEHVSVIRFLNLVGKDPAIGLRALSVRFRHTRGLASSRRGAGLMVHHGRLGRNPPKVPERPDPVLGRNVSHCCGSLWTKGPTSNHLYLLHQLVPITWGTVVWVVRWRRAECNVSKVHDQKRSSNGIRNPTLRTVVELTFQIGTDAVGASECNSPLQSTRNSSCPSGQ
jgi:hypothetical protein